MGNITYTLYAVMISAVITFLMRSIPFFTFHGEKKMPDWLERLGQMLPPGIMAVLIVYCLKDVVADIGELFPKLIAVVVVILSYRWKHNSFFSIIAGTGVYMLLLRITILLPIFTR